MKLPNFRLYETQATFSILVGLLALVACISLSVVVFKNFDAQSGLIAYNDQAGLGVYRKPLVLVGTGACLFLGALAGALGFSSLGQKRNTKQGRSWLGMTLGGLVIACAPVLYFAWQQLSEPIIQNTAN